MSAVIASSESLPNSSVPIVARLAILSGGKARIPLLPTPPSYQPGSGNPKAVRPKAALKTRRLPSKTGRLNGCPPSGGLTLILGVFIDGQFLSIEVQSQSLALFYLLL